MVLDNLTHITNTVDTLLLHQGILSTTFTSAIDTNYCHTVTHDEADFGRTFNSCVTVSAPNTPISLGLNSLGEQLTISNGGTEPISLTTVIDQVGTVAMSQTITKTVTGNIIISIGMNKAKQIYLPLITK